MDTSTWEAITHVLPLKTNLWRQLCVSVSLAPASSSGHDLRALAWSPLLGSLLRGESGSLAPSAIPLPLHISLALSQINK